ncbi:MAG: hypothetical protein AAGG02_02660 [Cyanobacteria bacterium P01_H01_bin.15]
MSESERDREIQKEILRDRKFSLAAAIAQEGGGFLKGESPVPRQVQVLAEINQFIDAHLADSSGALQYVLKQWLKGDGESLSQHEETPVLALKPLLSRLLDNENLYFEFVRQVDLKWGQMHEERPFFQRPGQPAHPDDEYSHDSVRERLTQLQTQLSAQQPDA